MWCECCGEAHDRWDMEMVEPEPVVFEINQLDPTVTFNFACPQCVTELVLTPMQTPEAHRFRSRNMKLRDVVAPVPVH